MGKVMWREDICGPMTANPFFVPRKQRRSECSTRSIPSQRESKKSALDKKGMWANLRVGVDLEPATAKMALASERKYRCRVVHSYLLLLCIVANTHANVGIARSTVYKL